MALGRLSVILDANIVKFESDMGRAARIAQQQSAAMQRSIEGAAKNIGSVLIGAFSVVAIEQFVKTSIDGMLQLNAAAKRVGMPVEQFSALSAAAKRADVDVQSFAAAMLAADRALAKAQSGTGAQAEAFKVLGIDPKQIKDNNDLILKAADALSKYRDGTGKAAVEMAIFGKSGAQLNAFLDQGSQTIKEQAQHMQDLGVAFGPDAQAQLAAYDNAQKEFSDTITGLRNKLALALLPSLQSATEYLGGMVKSMDKDTVSGFTDVVNTLARAVILLAAASKTVGRTLTEALGTSGRFIDALFTQTDIRHPIDSIKNLMEVGKENNAIDKEWLADMKDTWTKAIADVTSFGDQYAQAEKKATSGAVLTGADVPAWMKAGLPVGDNRPTIQFNPNIDAQNAAAIAKAQKLQAAYEAVAQELNRLAASDGVAQDPIAKANAVNAQGIIQLTKVMNALKAAGAPAAVVNADLTQGLAMLKQQLTFNLDAPKRELDAYSSALQNQLSALKASNDAQIQSMTLGDHAAQNLQQLAQAEQQATQALTDFVQAHQLHPEAMSEDMYAKKLSALKDYYAQRNKLIQQNQDAENAIRSNMDAGWQKGIADFIEQTNNKFAQGQQLAETFTSGFSDAFEKFASGAESAKKAFGDFIDSLFAQALKFVANKALQELFNSLSNKGGSTSAGSEASANMQLFGDSGFTSSGASAGSDGFWGSVASFVGSLFSSGKAGGGPVQPYSMQRVDELGPELLSVGAQTYLMMGRQGGAVTPNSQIRGAGGNTQYISVNVQPTSSRRTADQVAEAIARKQRIATARNG